MVRDIRVTVERLRQNPCRDLRDHVMFEMDRDEIRERIVGKHLEGLADLGHNIKAQLYIEYEELRKFIDISKLNPEARIAILFSVPSRETIDQFDMNADDLTIDHYRLFVHNNSRFLTKLFYKKINKEKLRMLKAKDWERLIGDVPRSAKDFPIHKFRNANELRHLILARPRILKYLTLNDMKESVINGPTWVRIVSKLAREKRANIPTGFKDWAEKEIFRLSLSGKNFRKFSEWKDGLADAD